jgi:exodeoxyribonuclease X
MDTAIIFDTESTGLVEPELIEAAWIGIVNPPTLTPVAEFSKRYKPSKPIELGALCTHNIYDEELEGCDPSATFALPNATYVIGHNIDYDFKVIGNPAGHKRICTQALSRSLWPDLDSHKQSAMIYYLERATARERLKNAHCAMDDVRNCLVLLGHIINKLGNITDWESLWLASEKARIPTIMPFGKHLGELIRTIPKDYVAWLKKQPDVDPYLLKALEQNR